MRGVEYGSGAENDRPYICLQDLELTLPRVAPELSTDTIRSFEKELFEIEREFAPPSATVTHVSAAELSAELERSALEIRNTSDGRTGIVYMDADLGRDDRLGARLDVSRSLDGEIVKRIGAVDEPGVQFKKIEQWMKDNNFRELVLVDDVLAFGDTLKEISRRVSTFKGELSGIPLRLLTGITSSGGDWRGLERATEFGLTVDYLQKAYAGASIEGVTKGLAIPTSRDLTMFGGKAGGVTIAGLSTAHPYMWPFSDPAPSIIDVKRTAEASTTLLDFNERLIEEIDTRRGTPLTLGDLALKGFGVPVVSVPRDEKLLTVEATPDMALAQYISTVRRTTGL